MKGLFSQARSAEGAERARAEREALLHVFQLIVNADAKFACQIIATFFTLLHERILQILSLLTHTISFSTLHTVQQTIQQTVQLTVKQTVQQTVFF